MNAQSRSLLTHFILALSAAGFVMQTSLQHPDTEVNAAYVITVFFSVLFIYKAAWHGLRLPFNIPLKGKILMFSYLAVITISSYYLQRHELYGLALMFIFCLVYFIEIGKWKGLRSVSFVKSLWLALVWAIVTAWIPLNYSLEREALLTVTERLLYMYAICIIYNFRDVRHDMQRGILTVPLRIGITKTKVFAVMLLIMNAVLVVRHGYEIRMTYAFFLSLAAAIVISLLARPDGNWLYYTLGVDGSMLLQFLLVVSFYV